MLFLQGATPLAYALVGDHPDLVSLLLSCGADPSARTDGVCKHTTLAPFPHVTQDLLGP